MKRFHMVCSSRDVANIRKLELELHNRSPDGSSYGILMADDLTTTEWTYQIEADQEDGTYFVMMYYNCSQQTSCGAVSDLFYILSPDGNGSSSSGESKLRIAEYIGM